MKIKTEIKYQEAYIPPRCRKERYRQTTKVINTTVPEAAYSDAPIAIRVQDCLHGLAADAEGVYPNGVAAVIKEVDGLQESEMWIDYRWYKNRLYRRLLAHEQYCGAKGAWSLDELVRRYATYKSWDASADCNMTEKAVRAELHQYLLLDGDVWVQTGEPIYTIATFGLGHNHASTNLMNGIYYLGYNEHEFFNALQRDEAITECKRVAMRRGDTNSIPRIGEFWRIEVLIPEAVKAPAHKAVAKDDFNNLAESLIRASGSAMEAGLLVMWAALAK